MTDTPAELIVRLWNVARSSIQGRAGQPEEHITGKAATALEALDQSYTGLLDQIGKEGGIPSLVGLIDREKGDIVLLDFIMDDLERYGIVPVAKWKDAVTRAEKAEAESERLNKLYAAYMPAPRLDP